MAGRRSNGSAPRKRSLRARMMLVVLRAIAGGPVAFPRSRLQSRSCLPPEHDVVEVPTLLFGHQGHGDATSSSPDAPSELGRALALAVRVVVNQQDEWFDTQ